VNGGRGPSASIRRRHAVPAAAPGRRRPPTPRSRLSPLRNTRRRERPYRPVGQHRRRRLSWRHLLAAARPARMSRRAERRRTSRARTRPDPDVVVHDARRGDGMRPATSRGEGAAERELPRGSCREGAAERELPRGSCREGAAERELPRGSCREAHWRTARSTIGTQPRGERRPRRMPSEDHRIVSGRLVRLGERPALDRAGGDQGVRSRSRTGPRSVSPRGDRSGHRLDGQYRRPPRGLTRRGS